MNRLLAFSVVAALLYPLAVSAVTRSTYSSYSTSGVSISLHDPIGSVYREGEAVGFSIRTDRDAYVIVFNIDTDGFVHLLYPARENDFPELSADRVYDIPADPGASLLVEGARGLEFVFAVAVEDRGAINEDEVHFLARNETLPADRKFRITGDPFLGANRVMSQLIRGTALRQDATVSFTYFYVGEAVDFPRYLCEECYDKGKDPYGTGMPQYVAVADFERTSGLPYPLKEGFAPESTAAAATAVAETQSSVTKVYVSYYPRWDDGFYSTSWWYLDPWYWNVWYGDPWYGSSSSFYFSIGWNWGWWGWGAYHYNYFPYYYGGPYYACRPGWGYYDCYPNYYYGSWYYPQPHRWRSYGVVEKGHRRSTLHTAMTQRVNRDFGVVPRSTKTFDAGDRRVASIKSLGDDRTIRSLDTRRGGRGADPQVIRSKPVRPSKDGRMVSQRDTRAREIRSGKGSYREQRVITRPQGTKRTFEGTRPIDTRRLEGRSGDLGRKAFERGRSQTGVRPDTNRRNPESRGTYTPNVRRGGGAKSAPRSSAVSPRSSAPPSKASAPSRAPASSKGSRQRR